MIAVASDFSRASAPTGQSVSKGGSARHDGR
jgi:hypothetical protein